MDKVIDIVFEEDKHRVVAYDRDMEIGEATFSSSEKIWIIDHTLVDESYKGQGIGQRLIEKIVGVARERKVKIIPLCPYARLQFEREVSYRDLL